MTSFAKAILLSLAVLSLASCGSKSSSTETGPAPIANPPIPVPVRAPASQTFEIESFAKIREFSETDRSALFGLKPASGKLVIEKVVGPQFIKKYAVGNLSASSIEKVFLGSTKPLTAAEKQNLLTEFAGAVVIYAEKYEGPLCNEEEIKYAITASGTLDGVPIDLTFRFEALPNSQGDCEFHVYGLEKYYQN